ncbi:MAG: hypothetical protein ACLTGG_05480 [Subdoligranulum sp.]
MKCAFGENPKRCYKDKCDSTRMSTAAFLRGALASARDYGARKAAANCDVTKMPLITRSWKPCCRCWTTIP